MLYHGGCHCGAVRFEVEAPTKVISQDCNCSICRLTGHIHLIVPRSRFRLTQGETVLVQYTFNTQTARHYFCGTCGIKSWYIPRSNPDGIDVNVRCLQPQPQELVIEPFDGNNWEAHSSELAHLSKEP